MSLTESVPRQQATTPSISIITVSRNSEETIGQTLQSVKDQSYRKLEHILIDGASSDNTLRITENLAWPGLQIQSEPDEGIADAMNKGVELASGEWVLFLNSDDYLLTDEALASATPLLTSDVDIVGFPVMYGDPGKGKLVKKKPRGANWYMNFKTGLMHQGTFIRKELFDSVGMHDTSLGMTMDYDFFLRAYKQGGRFRFYNEPVIAVMRDDGISSQRDWPSLSRRFEEEKRAQEKHSTGLLRLLYPLIWILYPVYRRVKHLLSLHFSPRRG